LYFDEQQIRQVIVNLIKNAVEAMADTHGDRKIEVSCLKDSPHNNFVITIRDNGPGFPDENIDNLLEPYVTHKPKGTGLGLAIVKKIIEDHEGQLLFNQMFPIMESSNLEGASISVVLPYRNTNHES
jgi:nitrogen fixation/metabolism regulation signal transduction histidine kinase